MINKINNIFLKFFEMFLLYINFIKNKIGKKKIYIYIYIYILNKFSD